MKIIFIGDVHGHTDRYQKMLRQKFQGQRTFQVGDMGIGFKGTPGLHKDIMDSGDHKWIRGNHDSPILCRAMVDRGYAGDYGYDPTIGLFWMGGAFSIDYKWRIPGVSWWPDEELSYLDLGLAITLYEKSKPKYVVSHDAPGILRDHLLGVVSMGHACGSDKLQSFASRTCGALDQMFQIHEPEEWVFGHYHVPYSFPFRHTKFTCVPELGTYTVDDERNQ